MIFLCSLIQTLTLTPPPNNALLANMDMRGISNIVVNVLSYGGDFGDQNMPKLNWIDSRALCRPLDPCGFFFSPKLYIKLACRKVHGSGSSVRISLQVSL